MIGKDLIRAAGYLMKDELVAIPTETVYGLAGNALSPLSVAKIFEAKNRPFFDPLIVHTHSITEAKKYVVEFPIWAEKLAEAFWPGPLTLLLPKNKLIPDIVTSGSELVGIRIPNHPFSLTLLQSLPFPLAAPSANPFGYVSPTTAQHVEEQLGTKIAYILDGGSAQVGVESTIVGDKGHQPSVFRTGGIPLEKLEEVLGQKITFQTSSSKPSAPGMLDSHYAPGKPLFVGNIPLLAKEKQAQRIGIISFHHDYSSLGSRSIVLSSNKNLQEAASRLFDSLRQMDKEEIDLIITEVFPEEGLGRAINDRLSRASFKR